MGVQALEKVFFTFHLPRLMEALSLYYAQHYRKRFTLGEIKKCSQYIAKTRQEAYRL